MPHPFMPTHSGHISDVASATCGGSGLSVAVMLTGPPTVNCGDFALAWAENRVTSVWICASENTIVALGDHPIGSGT